jgi:hypothetical protein
MREVQSECPRCGRRTYRKVDSWSGSPDASLDQPCEGGCEPLVAIASAVSGRSQASSLAPLLFGIALVAAPIVGVIEAVGR